MFGEIKTINKDHAVDLSNSTKRPGVLIYTMSSNNPVGILLPVEGNTNWNKADKTWDSI